MIDTGMTPERAQAIARDVLAEITGRRSGDGDSAAAAEQVLTERFPDLAEYDRTAVLFRVNRMLSARATRVARGGSGRSTSLPADVPQGDSMVGDAIANRRQARGITLDDLAAQVGVAPARMRNFELGHRRVPVAILARIAQVLHVDLEWFSGEGAAQAVDAAADAAEAVMGGVADAAADASQAAAPETGVADDRRSADLNRDELYGLYTQLTPAMRRLVAGIMREMVADRGRRADEDADAALRQSA